MSFNQAAVNTLISNVQSGAQQLGLFDQVLTHEPKSAPMQGVTLAFWMDGVKTSTKFSGLAAVSGIVSFQHRIYMNFISKPEDQIDSILLTATSSLINAYSTGFTLSGTVIAVDLLGIDSPGITARWGYVTIDQRKLRISDLLVPIIIDNLWTETP